MYSNGQGAGCSQNNRPPKVELRGPYFVKILLQGQQQRKGPAEFCSHFSPFIPVSQKTIKKRVGCFRMWNACWSGHFLAWNALVFAEDIFCLILSPQGTWKTNSNSLQPEQKHNPAIQRPKTYSILHEKDLAHHVKQNIFWRPIKFFYWARELGEDHAFTSV